MKKKFERQIPELPKTVEFCKKCVMSNQRPRISFDREGICTGCRNSEFYKDSVDWEERERELVDLLDRYRRKDGHWDVLVPSSGGKDSSFTAHQLKYHYGMNPLTITWTPLIYTDIGYKNFQSLRDAGFTNILCSPNGKLHRKLSRLCFEELGDAFHTFVLGQACFVYHVALKFNIPLVFFGENGEAEYAGNPKVADRPFVPFKDWSEIYFKGSNLDELVDFGLREKSYFSKQDYTEGDLIFYEPPSVDEMESKGIFGCNFFGYYKKWIPQENYYYAVENTGFRPNPERTEGTYSKYASLDDRLDGFHYFMKYVKFGFGRATDDAAHEIRDGHITREEGIALVHRYDGEFPQKYFQDFLNYLDIDEEHFWEIADGFRLPHIWDKKNEGWTLKQKVS